MTDIGANIETGDAATANDRAARDSMFLHATIRQANGGGSATVRVRNLSAGGMMVETSPSFAREDKVEVELRGTGVVTGRIAWVDETRLGVAFDRHIDPMAARTPIGGIADSRKFAVSPQNRRPALKA